MTMDLETNHDDSKDTPSTLPESHATLAPDNETNDITEIVSESIVPSQPVISEARFLEGMRSGFDPSEIAHLSESQQDRLAMAMAAAAVNEWNESRKAEIKSHKGVESDAAQSAMASEIFMAVMAHLESIPSSVKDKVIIKFQSLPSPRKLIVL